MVPKLPRRATGTPYHQRRRCAAFEVSPEQTRNVIHALPEWSTSGKVVRFAIRARFILAYETSLRPSTFDRICAPEHYRSGADRLHLTADTDKARFTRDVPLTKRARRVLDYLLRALEREHGAPYEGLLFGHHDYRTTSMPPRSKRSRPSSPRSSPALTCAAPASPTCSSSAPTFRACSTQLDTGR